MKKKFFAAFTLCMGIMTTSAFAMEKTDVDLFYCGRDTKLDNPIYMENNDYFVPMRECAEQIGCTVDYVPNKGITIQCPNGRVIEYDFHSPVLSVVINNLPAMGGKIVNINGISYMNVEDFYNHLGYEISMIQDYGVNGIRVGSRIKNIGISENDFQWLNVVQKNQNSAFSPISVKLSLALLANGTTGQTQTELLKVLGFSLSNKALEEVNNFITDALRWTVTETNGDYIAKQNQGRIQFANSLWYNSGNQKTDTIFSENFQNIAKNVFHATANNVTTASAADIINQWIAKETEGMITKIIDNADFETAFINTTYFKCSWRDAFDKSNTKKDIFYNIDNTQSSIDFMNDKKYAGYAETDGWQMLSLPYSDHLYKMYLFLPEQGNTQNLDYQTINKLLLFQEPNTKVNITMPKFTIESQYDLKPLLENMGISTMFQNNNDFNAMYANGKGHCITDALQKTKIVVDEQGTVAASATALEYRDANFSELPVFQANRPFTYMITRRSGDEEVLFVGQYVTGKE